MAALLMVVELTPAAAAGAGQTGWGIGLASGVRQTRNVSPGGAVRVLERVVRLVDRAGRRARCRVLLPVLARARRQAVNRERVRPGHL